MRHLCAIRADMKGSQDENQAGEGGVGGDSLEPVIVDVEEDHLRLSRPEDEVAELLYLQAGLEGELQLGSLDDDVGEIQL